MLFPQGIYTTYNVIDYYNILFHLLYIFNTTPSVNRSEHHRIPFLHHEICVIECDKEYEYLVHGHDVVLKIPRNALPVADQHKVCIEVGVAMYGPFNFPENIHPISPILWLNLIDKNTQITKPFQISLPHCLAKVINEQVCFVRTDTENVGVNDLYGKCTICGGGDIYANHGILETSCYSGLYCLALVNSSHCTDMNYCLAQVNVLPSPALNEFYFYALYNLPTHKRVS